MFFMNYFFYPFSRLTLNRCAWLLAALPLFSLQAAEINTDSAQHDHASHQQSSAPNAKAAIATLYQCPMHPHVLSEQPGNCPICGMDLVARQPQDSAQGSANQIQVTVTSAMQQTLGLRTKNADYSTLWRYIETFGTVEFDETALSHIHARISGWVENLTVYEIGQSVKQGQHLYDLYAPDLVTAQDDYLMALDYVAKDPKRGKVLLRKAQLRLELLGVTKSVIEKLKRSRQTMHRVPFYAPQDGIVTASALREGMYIEPGVTLLELVDLARVWVIANVFENEQSWLQVGRQVEITAAANFQQQASIDYIYPQLDPVTKAMKVRIAVANPELALRPGAIVDVAIYGGPMRQRLTIPREALIQTGQENRVIVKLNSQTFNVASVQVGMIAQGKAEILSGLQQGDEVVVSGQFLIDSEASLQGALQRLPSAPHAEHKHH